MAGICFASVDKGPCPCSSNWVISKMNIADEAESHSPLPSNKIATRYLFVDLYLVFDQSMSLPRKTKITTTKSSLV